MDTAILTEMLSRFISVATMGYTALLPDALYLMNFFIIVEIVILGVFWALGKGGISITVIQKLTMIGFFIWIINNAQRISNAIMKSLGQLGLIAGGRSIDVSNLMDPSAIIDFGFKATRPIFDNIGGPWSVFTSPVDIMIFSLCGCMILFSYFAIGWNIFITIIEFYLFTVCCVILIPFKLFNHTSFLADAAIKGTFKFGVKFMVLGFVISISYSSLKSFAVTDDPTFQQLFSMLLGTGAIAYLCWHAPSIASNIVMGQTSNTSFANIYGAASGAAGSSIAMATKFRSQGVNAFKQAANIGKMGKSVMGK